VKGEICDFSLEQGVKPGLGNAKRFGGLFLRHAAIPHQLFNADHQIGTQGEILCFALRKAQIGEDIAAAL